MLRSAPRRTQRRFENGTRGAGHFYHLDGDLPVPEAELSEALLSLLQRGRSVLADYEALRAESDAAWNFSAWAYATHVADLHCGDQVEVNSPNGKVIFHCRYLQPDDYSDGFDPSALCMSGPVSRKDGSPGKKSNGSAKLFSDEWKLAGRARPEWLNKLREFWP